MIKKHRIFHKDSYSRTGELIGYPRTQRQQLDDLLQDENTGQIYMVTAVGKDGEDWLVIYEDKR